MNCRYFYRKGGKMKLRHGNFDAAILMSALFTFLILSCFDTLSVFATSLERTSPDAVTEVTETADEAVTEYTPTPETEVVPEDAAPFTVNDVPYGGEVCEENGKFLLRPAELADFLFGECEYTAGETFAINGETFELFTDRDYVLACGRCIPFPRAVYKDGEVLADASALFSLFGLTYDGVNVTGEPSLPVSAGEFYCADDLYWLSKIIYAESRGEELTGKIAVGNVVLNRVHSDGFPSTVYGVIFDDSCGVQFSPTADGTIYLEPDEESVIAAKLCLEGYTVSDEILYFVNAAIAADSWVQTNRPYVMAIGSHDFYA